MHPHATNNHISIVLIDTQSLVRQSLQNMITAWPGMEVVGEAGEGSDGLRLIERLRPAISILDITWPGAPGLELIPGIRACSPRTAILILTMHEDPDFIFRAFRAGCKGYFLKSDSAEELKQALRVVAMGRTYVSPGIAAEVFDLLIARTDKHDGRPSLLTLRELETCSLLARGRSTEQVASHLCISPKTVRCHVAAAKKKLACNSRIELALRLREMDQKRESEFRSRNPE